MLINPLFQIQNVEKDSPAIFNKWQLPGPEHFSDGPNTSPQVNRGFIDGIKPF